jgi:hypothetical protein
MKLPAPPPVREYYGTDPLLPIQVWLRIWNPERPRLNAFQKWLRRRRNYRRSVQSIL